jgi:raffinose/stachyose/melibiose transport system permease protein
MASTAVAPSAGRPSPVRRRRIRITPIDPFRYFFAILIVLVTVLPLLVVILGGFKTNGQINADPVGLPAPWTTSNYARILGSPSFWQYLLNSFVIAVAVTALVLVFGSMAAFALSRYSFRGREVIFGTFTLGLLFPLAVATLPVYLLLRQLNLTDNFFGVILPETAFALPVTIIILRPFMAAIPNELEDAAVVDGATRLTFFWRILLPLSRPALVTVAVLAFITASWNGYLLPLLVFTDQSQFTLPLGVATFQSQFSADTASILAFTSLSIVPALAFFIFAERQIVGGLTGSVKG